MTLQEYNMAVDQWADALYRFALKQLAAAGSARDIVQDCFERLWIHHKNVDALKVKSWLFTTAHHAMIDSIRKQKRENLVSAMPFQESTVEQEYPDLQEILGMAVSRLPEIQRSVLLLRDYEGYSYREIGEMTGLSESQVKVYIYRSRIFLKQFIGTPDRVI